MVIFTNRSDVNRSDKRWSRSLRDYVTVIWSDRHFSNWRIDGKSQCLIYVMISEIHLETFRLNLYWLVLVVIFCLGLIFLLNFALTNNELLTCDCKSLELNTKKDSKDCVNCYLCDKPVSMVSKSWWYHNFSISRNVHVLYVPFY